MARDPYQELGVSRTASADERLVRSTNETSTPTASNARIGHRRGESAVSATRYKKVGMMAKVNTTMSNLMPGVAEKMAAKYVDRQHYDERPRHPDGTLHQPSQATSVVGQTHGTAPMIFEDEVGRRHSPKR